jgi:hypothetical protein
MKRKFLYGLFYLALFLLLSGAAMFLWNAILPQMTHLTVINYWQALGLMILCRILFGRFRLWGPIGRQHNEGRRFMDETGSAAFKEEWRKRFERKGNN